MSPFILLTPYLSDRDAIGNDILETRRLLTSEGHRVEICAELVDLKGDRILTIDKARKLSAQPENVLIYHHSVGWERGLQVVLNAKCRRVVRYHNITPSVFFSCYNPGLAAACRSGREHLARLAASNIELFVSDSEFNHDELLALGVDAARARVVPPFHVIHKLSAAPTDERIAERCGERRVNLLTVGRMAANKGHAHLLKAFAAYHHLYNRDSRLWIVGKEDPGQSEYGRAIRRLAAVLALNDGVIFTGGVSEAALKTLYQSADAFVITSEHEGFCVPVVEAMAFETPVIAYGATALPGTIGDAGIVWDRLDPILFAQTVEALVADSEAAEALRRRGRLRYDRHFSLDRIAERFRESLQSVMPDLSPGGTPQLPNEMVMDGFDIDDFKRQIDSDARQMKARLLSARFAPGLPPRIAEEMPPRMSKLFNLICECESLKDEQTLEQIEQHLSLAAESDQLSRELPTLKRRSSLMRWAFAPVAPIIDKLHRFLTRQQSIYNANTNQALFHFMAMHHRTLTQLKEMEKRIAVLESPSHQRRLAA